MSENQRQQSENNCESIFSIMNYREKMEVPKKKPALLNTHKIEVNPFGEID